MRLSVRSETILTWKTALAEHEGIYRALEARDPQAAAAAMCTHLRSSQDRWIGEPATSPDTHSTDTGPGKT